MNGTQKLCILTVHGIGFQQPPTASAAGYADLLHENLREALGDRLGSDPQRKPAPYGPVFPEGAGPCQGGFAWGFGCLRACVTGVSCFPDSCHVRGERPGRSRTGRSPAAAAAPEASLR